MNGNFEISELAEYVMAVDGPGGAQAHVGQSFLLA